MHSDMSMSLNLLSWLPSVFLPKSVLPVWLSFGFCCVKMKSLDKLLMLEAKHVKIYLTLQL